MSCAPQMSAAVVASPKTTRSSSVSERRPFAPVTPQRNGRANRMRVASSPLTPSNSNSSVSSPFTPITNMYSSTSSLVSPAHSSVSTKVDFSPEANKSKHRSVADVTNNWRSRAKENGIRVDHEELTYAYSDTFDSPKENVPHSFLSNHRRSRQALFQASSSDGMAFISPKTARMPIHDGVVSASIPSSLASSLLRTPESAQRASGAYTLATPSPRSSIAIAQNLRQRGSASDPARPRRRHISGPISGETLFDIDENAPSSGPYHESFGSPITLRGEIDTSLAKAKRCVSAPFIAARFYDAYDDEEDDGEFEDDGLPVGPKSSRMRTTSVSSQPTLVGESTSKNACSVCSASSSPLSILIPCNHLICSSCLTSSLNIVGEKDMSCATCEDPVENFKLLAPLKIGSSMIDANENSNDTQQLKDQEPNQLLPSAFEDLVIKDREGNKYGQAHHEEHTAQKGSVVPSGFYSNYDGDITVLRIDNVPWDATPITLLNFFSPHAVVRAHILLDPKGKTLSHAYAEVPASDARNALRGVQNKTLGKGRRLRGVTVTMSGQVELMRSLFPSWLGGFDGTHPTLDGLDHATMVRTLENGIITLPEIEGLATLMKNPKSHYLKAPSLPFYSLVSILSKFPADGDSRVFWSGKLRDILYELTNNACSLLVDRIHTEFGDQRVLEIVVTTAVKCLLFTDDQRHDLFERAADGAAAKGVQLSCSPPLSFLSSLMSPGSDASILPGDSASSVSVSTTSAHNGRMQRLHGYGKPSGSMIQQNVNPFTHPAAVSYGGSLQSPFINASSQAIGAPPGLGPPNAMNVGMPYSLDASMHAPFAMLAREFNLEPDLVAALAQRLACSGQSVVPHTMGPFGYTKGQM